MKQIILDHLRDDYTYPVRDPLWKHIYLSKTLKQITGTKEFLRLGRIKQLGPASLIYPGATHTRLNHSLGVFFLSYNIVLTLIQKKNCPALSLSGVKSFLSAALLHDLGHFPHAHSFKELPLKDHESLSSEILLKSSISGILKQDSCDPLFCAAIIDKDRNHRRNKELVFYRNLLSGVLDPDKLDYLNRDAYFCGVPYGVQDTDYVLSQILPIETGIAIPHKGITAIENVLFSKYLMYKTIYWHKGVRISTALVKKAVFLALKEGQLDPEKLYGMDDDSFYRRMSNLNEPIASMMMASENPYCYNIIGQWDYQLDNPSHGELTDLETRNIKEREIAGVLNKNGFAVKDHEVIIDLTGKVSFEVDLPVISHGRTIPFPETDTVFTRDVVHDFTDGLQKIRLMIPQSVLDSRGDLSDIEDILHIIHAKL